MAVNCKEVVTYFKMRNKTNKQVSKHGNYIKVGGYKSN